MNDILRSPVAAPTITDVYEKNGYYFPYDVTSGAEAAALLADLEAAEAEVGDEHARLSLLRGYPSQLLPSFAGLIRHPRLIEAASQIIGRDLLVWSCGFFIKEAGSKSFVSWHQDLNYWGLDGDDEVTAWFALTPAMIENGCMRFVPGSHRKKDVAHVDSFAADNLLTRGQEIAVEVDEASGARTAACRPGVVPPRAHVPRIRPQQNEFTPPGCRDSLRGAVDEADLRRQAAGFSRERRGPLRTLREHAPARGPAAGRRLRARTPQCEHETRTLLPGRQA